MVCPTSKPHFSTLLQSVVVLVAVIAIWPTQSLAQAPTVQNGVTVGPVTGFPLPRFVSIRPDEANVRVGPGSAYSVSWTFVRAGLPVEITAEFGNWRKIRDMEGDEGWIRHDLLTGRRTVVIAPWSSGDPVPARRAPNPDSNTRYLLEPGVVARVLNCNGSWCAVESDNERTEWRGFVRQSSVWGAYPDEVFEAD